MFTMPGDQMDGRRGSKVPVHGLFGAIAGAIGLGSLVQRELTPDPPEIDDPPGRDDEAVREAAMRERRRSQSRRSAVPGRQPTILGSGTFAPVGGQGASQVGTRTLLGGG